ncbi:MAG: sigma-54 dependent transcriptional regulator [Pyrinomonadaceae bacterium]
MKAKILVVEDDSRLRALLLESLILEGHTPHGVESAEAAIQSLGKENFDILLTDVNLPGKTGIDLLPVCSRLNPNTYMLVMTGYASVDVAVNAMKLGAADFLTKPISLSDLLNAIRVAVGKIPAQKSNSVDGFPVLDSPIIAKSSIMLELLKQIETIAPYKINALVTGETGTGKELIARAIHQISQREKNAFVALNCAAIPEQLLEDELFGHVKGAFTGAQTDRKGRFEQADGGTLFLDEIGDMNLALQAKLLRVLQESEFEKLGSSKTTKVDVRVVAATSSDLEKKIADNSFRADLFHRLNVVHLRVPPLRERPDDIMPLAKGLLERFCKSAGLPAKTIADEVVHVLISYSFPGNVRQLQNSMERAAVFSGAASEVKLEHLPEEIKKQANLFQIPPSFMPREIPDEGINFTDVVSQVERELLLQTLEKTGGNKMRAAKLLNIKRTTLIEKLKRLQIETDNDANDADDPVSILA